ncbi:hemerythrin domain-containing protein [Sphingomonas sp. BGYR3]|uniref:hemerythrin domain-containing protein n=1 Tax=Sphingomonas sp. BGYR3 TaxID=2975483 RepID=UPI0021A46ADE|nr:hemerythrin domain-containing protein [Sphingomonas sp. BGYR3]MDG5488333.1 hemerythrin domain-containing protein [Sphingomonas sp. BGYR3]
MLSFERLIREHRLISQLGGQLRHALSIGADTAAAHGAMTTLSDTLIAHLHAEDSEIYPQLMISRDAGAAHAARVAVERFKTLASDWIAHVAFWTPSAISQNRPGFDAATLAILARLDARIAQENELLYPMALSTANLPLRDQAA